MADKCQYNKLALRLAKGQLTKGITKLDDACKEIVRVPEELPMASKVRVAAKVIEALSISIVSEKVLRLEKLGKRQWHH